jgi:hypothetical protein
MSEKRVVLRSDGVTRFVPDLSDRGGGLSARAFEEFCRLRDIHWLLRDDGVRVGRDGVGRTWIQWDQSEYGDTPLSERCEDRGNRFVTSWQLRRHALTAQYIADLDRWEQIVREATQ